MSEVILRRGHALTLQRDTWYWCIEGTLLIRILDLREICIGFVQAHQVFQGPTEQDPERMCEALSLARMVPITKALNTEQILGLQHRLHQTEHLMGLLHCGDISTRFWLFLQYLETHHAQVQNTDKVVPFRLTQAHIARILGVTRVTVTRLMKRYEDQGYIQRTLSHQIQILNLPPEALS